jgi:hypothetical protein
MAALSFFDCPEGYILTTDTRDEILVHDKKIHVIPAWHDVKEIL